MLNPGLCPDYRKIDPADWPLVYFKPVELACRHHRACRWDLGVVDRQGLGDPYRSAAARQTRVLA